MQYVREVYRLECVLKTGLGRLIRHRCSELLFLFASVSLGRLQASSGLAVNFALLCDQKWLLTRQFCYLAVEIVQVFVMTTKIATLGESLVADLAAERPLGRVLAEMIAQVAALGEGGVAAVELATEVQLHALGSLISHLNDLVPLRWNALEFLRELRWVGNLNHMIGIRSVATLRVGLGLCQARLSTLELRAHMG